MGGLPWTTLRTLLLPDHPSPSPPNQHFALVTFSLPNFEPFSLSASFLVELWPKFKGMAWNGGHNPREDLQRVRTSWNLWAGERKKRYFWASSPFALTPFKPKAILASLFLGSGLPACGPSAFGNSNSGILELYCCKNFWCRGLIWCLRSARRA